MTRAAVSLAFGGLCLTHEVSALSKASRGSGLNLQDDSAEMKLKLKDYGCEGDFVKPGDTNLVAVIAGHPGCDVTWLVDEPHEAHIISDIAKDGSHRYTGYEGGAYLSFILKNYDHLPDKMAFMHAHRNAWEVNDEANILSDIDAKSYPYAGLSKKWAVDLREPDIALTRSFLQETLGDKEAAKLPTERFNFSFPSAASFLVTKERILARSKKTWQKAYDWLQSNKGKQNARALEFSWHVLMGENAQMNPPNPSVLCPNNPEACMHEPYVDASFPKWRLEWYNSHDVGGKKAPISSGSNNDAAF